MREDDLVHLVIEVVEGLMVTEPPPQSTPAKEQMAERLRSSQRHKLGLLYQRRSIFAASRKNLIAARRSPARTLKHDRTLINRSAAQPDLSPTGC